MDYSNEKIKTVQEKNLTWVSGSPVAPGLVVATGDDDGIGAREGGRHQRNIITSCSMLCQCAFT